ncbi:MAG TPA: hypothetical protein VNI83_10680 [Vicinamibacterales bacterium]|nr:hypothetical protein [Vicinamibacterales bacterium]
MTGLQARVKLKGVADRTRCPLCGTRRARRACPALGRAICAVCCGTKRLVEIRCPESCSYLRGAEIHPPAPVRRRHERDAAFLAAGLAGAPERERALALVVMAALRTRAEPALDSAVLGAKRRDRDLADAAGALAETLEVASRGVIYEAQPARPVARQLLTDLRERIDRLLARADRTVERELASAARRVERMARDAAAALGGGDTAFVEFLERVLADERPASPAPARLIVPPA